MTEDNKTGIVIGSNGGLYSVSFADGETISCKGRGRFRHEKVKLLTGDRVIISYADDGSAVINEILPRKNSMIRPPVSNLDILFCVGCVSSPKVDILTFDKLIVSAEKNQIEPVIILTKCDEDREGSEEFADIYKKSGFTVFVVSNKTGEGIDALRDYLKLNSDKISALSGASGAGKSSLLNSLFGNSEIEIGSLSEKIGRGKQTTRQCNLYPLSKLLNYPESSGFLADTPGFSMLDFVNFDFCNKEELPLLFREFRPYLISCKYTKCRHTKEEGCAVKEKVKEGIIPSSRHESFVLIYDEIKDKHDWDK